MATQITLDSEQVLSIATQIESDNLALRQLLDDSKSTINALTTYWTGSAAESTIASYDSFASNYFETYYEVLEQYVKFLRNNVSDQYQRTEQSNLQLADRFK